MNDSMGEYVGSQVIKLMIKKGIQVLKSNILLLGFTFKENCPDVRNTKVIDIVRVLQDYDTNVTIYDPWANSAIAKKEYGVDILNTLPQGKKFDSLILAVAHDIFKSVDVGLLLREKGVFYDVKGISKNINVDGRL